MKNEQRYREIQSRERIIQVFLIISGFLLAYSKGSIVILFNMFILFAILYYIFLTRTKNNYFTNLLGFFTAYIFSVLLLHFMNTQGSELLSDVDFIVTFISLTAIFTFALLTPSSSKKLIKDAEKFLKKMIKKHPKAIKYFVKILVAIVIIVILYRTISFYIYL